MRHRACPRESHQNSWAWDENISPSKLPWLRVTDPHKGFSALLCHSHQQHRHHHCENWPSSSLKPFLTSSSQSSPLLLLFSHSVLSDSLQPHGLQPTRLLCLWNSPGKNTGVSCCFLLQGIFPTQGSNPGLLHCT